MLPACRASQVAGCRCAPGRREHRLPDAAGDAGENRCGAAWQHCCFARNHRRRGDGCAAAVCRSARRHCSSTAGWCFSSSTLRECRCRHCSAAAAVLWGLACLQPSPLRICLELTWKARRLQRHSQPLWLLGSAGRPFYAYAPADPWPPLEQAPAQRPTRVDRSRQQAGGSAAAAGSAAGAAVGMPASAAGAPKRSRLQARRIAPIAPASSSGLLQSAAASTAAVSADDGPPAAGSTVSPGPAGDVATAAVPAVPAAPQASVPAAGPLRSRLAARKIASISQNASSALLGGTTGLPASIAQQSGSVQSPAALIPQAEDMPAAEAAEAPAGGATTLGSMLGGSRKRPAEVCSKAKPPFRRTSPPLL